MTSPASISRLGSADLIAEIAKPSIRYRCDRPPPLANFRSVGGSAMRLLMAVLALVLFAGPAANAEKRVALLVGNQSYGADVGPLKNPHNDVALLEGALKGLGFEITVVRDAGLGALTRAVNAYTRRLQAAGPGAIGFFYYSCHGASDGGTNYLIPTDVKTTEAGALWDE